MVLLTQLRQRIKTVGTIQKTTNAMRVTAISTHSRLQKKKNFLDLYNKEIDAVLRELDSITIPSAQHNGRHLIILVGSQKGLCGSFNSRLFNFFEREHPVKELQREGRAFDLVSVGRKVLERLDLNKVEPLNAYNTFNSSNFVAIAHELTQLILGPKGYDKVTVYSNQPITFFVQESTATNLVVPESFDETIESQGTIQSSYEFEENPALVKVYVEQMHMRATLENLLFKSLIAEQAARFVSMDMATRNAEDLNTSMLRDYNKLRQALITREITDLAGGIL